MDFLVFANVLINGNAQNLSTARFITLKGEVISTRNRIETDGNLYEINTSLLHLMRSKINFSKGTVLILSGGGYEKLNIKNEAEKMALFLNSDGFDVAILEYHVSKKQNRDLALSDALQGFKLLKKDQNKLS